MTPISILANLRFQDILDILFLTVVAYYLYLWFRGTKAFKALVGLLVMGIVFTVARTWGLFLTTWVFQILWQVAVILLIILFQSEIRQVLERVNPLKALGFRKFEDPGKWISGFTEGVFDMAKRRIGALIILERMDGVEEWITGGHTLSGEPGPELLMSIFQKESPLHDGAMLVRGGEVALVACYLPLSSAEGLPKDWGTRHRAALGLAEKCDAGIVVVSEEKGDVSFALEGQPTPIESPKDLSQKIMGAIKPPSPPKVSFWKKTQSVITNQWPVKAGSLALVTFSWLLFAGQQDFERTIHVPLKAINIPNHMDIVQPLSPQLRITARGLRKDASTLNEENVSVEVDVSLAQLGQKRFSITRDNIVLPNDRIHIVRIEPSQVAFEFKEKSQPQEKDIGSELPG